MNEPESDAAESNSGEIIRPIFCPTRGPTSCEADGQTSAIERVLDSRWTVFALLFGVMGALGIPLLWCSRQFTRREKVIWSIVVTIYTLVLAGIAAGAVWYAWAQWQALMG